VAALLRIQEKEARWWRDACILYFQTFSKRPIPSEDEAPTRSLDELMKVHPHYVPGLRYPAGEKP